MSARVVIDPENAAQVMALARAWDSLDDGYFTPGPDAMSVTGYRMQYALRIVVAEVTP